MSAAPADPDRDRTVQQKTFLVTGATGATGRHTATLLLEQGHRVRALVHRTDARADALAARGADVVVGDLLRLPDVRRAVQGVDAAYFVYPLAPGTVTATAYVAQAALDAGVDTVVNMSQIVARPDAASHASLDHWVAERVLDRSGVGVTHLRPTFFAEWLLYNAASIATDHVLALPFTGNTVALIAAQDQARVIAAILTDPQPHRGRTYPLHGAVDMTWPEIAAEVSAVLGHDVTYRPTDVEDFTRSARAAGIGEFAVQHLSAGGVPDFRNGLFAGTDDIVATISGRAPMTVRAFVEQNRSAFVAPISASAR